MTYTEGFKKKLKLPSLAHRRRCGDMIQTFRIIKGIEDPKDFFKFSTSSSGAFTNRNVPEWTGMDLHNRNGPQNSPSNTCFNFLRVLDKKFWLSNVKYHISSVSRHFQCKKKI